MTRKPSLRKVFVSIGSIHDIFYIEILINPTSTLLYSHVGIGIQSHCDSNFFLLLFECHHGIAMAIAMAIALSYHDPCLRRRMHTCMHTIVVLCRRRRQGILFDGYSGGIIDTCESQRTQFDSSIPPRDNNNYIMLVHDLQ